MHQISKQLFITDCHRHTGDGCDYFQIVQTLYLHRQSAPLVQHHDCFSALRESKDNINIQKSHFKADDVYRKHLNTPYYTYIGNQGFTAIYTLLHLYS